MHTSKTLATELISEIGRYDPISKVSPDLELLML